jgi:drug/metabolite transporter (DMT)-like permease
MDLAIALTLVAAMLLGAGWVLQQHAAEQTPQAYFLRLALIVDLLHRPRWLLGMGVMISGQLLSAWSVGHLDLTLYEPLLATSLIFALALAVPLSRQRLRVTELIGAVILSGGVAALSLSRSPGTPSASFGSFSDWPAAAGIALVAYCCIHAGHLRSGRARATLTGIGTGLVFGVSDALTRRTVQILDAHSFSGLLTSWPPYCLLAAALIGMWLMQNSFSAAPLHTSLPGITAAEPVAGILLGVVVFGDRIDISPGMLAVQAVGIAALVVGVVMVARAPLLSQVRAAVGSSVAGSVPGSGGRSRPPEDSELTKTAPPGLTPPDTAQNGTARNGVARMEAVLSGIVPPETISPDTVEPGTGPVPPEPARPRPRRPAAGGAHSVQAL